MLEAGSSSVVLDDVPNQSVLGQRIRSSLYTVWRLLYTNSVVLPKSRSLRLSVDQDSYQDQP